MLLCTGTNALQQAHAAVTSSLGCLKCQWAGYLFLAKYVLKFESLYVLYWQTRLKFYKITDKCVSGIA